MAKEANLVAIKPSSHIDVAPDIALLSQQIWCWGRDILHPKGNLLVDQGFEIIKHNDNNNVKNIYSLILCDNCRIILRGFGIIYTNKIYGTIFIPRYEFIPKFSPILEFENLPWKTEDVEDFTNPIGAEQEACSVMLAEVIEWIIKFEQNIIDIFGFEYRKKVLDMWDNGKRRIFPAEMMIPEWEKHLNSTDQIMQLGMHQ